MFANLRTQFAVQRAVAKCEKMAHNNIIASMAIIASQLEHEAKNKIVPVAVKPLEQLSNKHTERVRKWVVKQGHSPITFYKAQLDSVLTQAIECKDLTMDDIKDQTNDNVLKKLVNLQLLPARFLDLEDQL